MPKLERKYIFITGVARSGTTLLQAMLNAHPDICFPPETQLIKKRKNPLPILDALADQQGSRHVGDKDPMISRHLPYLKKICPMAYVVMIERDIRDVVASRMNVPWGKKMSFTRHVAEALYMTSRANTDGPALFEEKYITVSYEQLVLQPQLALKDLCKQLGIPYSEEMLHFYQSADSLIRDHERDWKQKILKPLDPSSIGRYKKHLTPEQLEILRPNGRIPFSTRMYIYLFTNLLHLKDG